MIVDFFLAGVQKAGTTAIWKYLRQHPDVFMPNVKELHFFDDEGIDWAKPDYSRFHQHFTASRRGLLKGEATPIYTYWPPSMDRIAQYNPNARFIISLRDPVARAFSHWRMETVRGAETMPFEYAIREGRRRVSDDPTMPGCHRVFSYVERGFYGRQLEAIYRVFDPSRVLIVRHADLKSDINEQFAKICDFLELPHFPQRLNYEEIFSFRESHLRMNSSDQEYLRYLYSGEAELLKSFGIDLENEPEAK